MRLPRTLRHGLFVTHQVLGLTIGLVLVISGLTGAILCFRQPLDRALEPDIHVVQASGEPLPLDVCLAALNEAEPEATIGAVDLPKQPDAPLHVWLAEGEAFVDPYTAEVLAVRSDDESFTGAIFHLHTELLAGKVGHTILGLAGLAVPLLAVTGLLLAWPRRGQWRTALAVRWQRGFKAANFDLHRAAGLLSALFLIVVATTGATLQFSAPFEKLLGKELSPPRATAVGSPLALQTLLDRARAAVPGGVPTRVYLPKEAGEPVLMRLRMAAEYHPNGRSQVWLDSVSGEVLLLDDTTRDPWWRRLFYERYPLHIGSYAGGWSHAFHALLGLSLAFLTVSGVAMLVVRKVRRRRAERPATAQGS